MTVTNIEFNLLDADRPFAPQRHRIGLVVRGMSSPGSPPLSQGHADCVLPLGAPIGFFGDLGPAAAMAESGGSLPGASGSVVNPSGESTAGGWVSTGTVLAGISGCVYQYTDFLRERPHYVQRELARSQGECSTLLVIDVSTSEAQRFEQAWTSMRADPGQFGYVGLNCATHAGYAFALAGLLTTPSRALGTGHTTEILGLDSPANLYYQLISGPANSRFESYSGYLGFEPLGHGQYRVSIDTL